MKLAQKSLHRRQHETTDSQAEKTIADKPMLQPLKDMDDNLLLLAGGLPLTVNNTVIGATAHPGGAPGGHLDVQCAEAAINKVL